MKRLCFFTLSFLLLGAGCVDSVDSVGVNTDQIDGLEDVSVAQPAGYVNKRYYYQFDPPEGVQLLALSEDKTATLADEDSKIVFLILDETNLFTIRAIEDTRSVHEWLSQEVGFFYPTGEAGQWVDDLGGQQAIFLSGSGDVGSPARVIVARHGDYLFVLSYDREEEQYQELLRSFTFL